MIPIDLSEYSEEEIAIKIETGFMFWEMDYAAMDFTQNTELNISHATPFTAFGTNSNDWKSALEKTGNLFKALNMLKQIREKYQNIFGEPLMTKVTKVDNRYFWRLAAPGFPSKASVRIHENEVNRFIPNETSLGLRSLLFAITKKCPMNCEHYFKWNNLNQKEKLSVADIIHIIHKYQNYVRHYSNVKLGAEETTLLEKIYLELFAILFPARLLY